MKHCGCCDRWLPLSEFSKNASRLDGLQSSCTECQRAYVRHHYAENRDYYLAKAKRANHRRYDELRLQLIALKSVPCTDCGQHYPPWVMDFDHVRGVKLFDVGRGLRGHAARMLSEAAKCEVVCANCHRDRTHRRLMNAPIAQPG